MTYTLSPEEFMATPQPEDDGPDETPAYDDGPLASIAESLAHIASSLSAPDQAAELRQNLDELEADLHAQLQAQGQELEAAKAQLEETVAEVLGICKKSTSKLAHEIRAALEGTPAETHAQGPQCPACERYFVDAELLDRHECSAMTPQSDEPPAHDAPVEEWVAFAQARGLDVDPGRTNRSQIRTMLGIPQPVAGGEG